MKIVGLAGASGTGKSTIAAHLTTRGGVHIDADLIGHDLLNHDPEVRAGVESEFGGLVFKSDGSVDRRKLGAIVFNDAERLAALNAVVHPAIRRECAVRIESSRRKGAPFVVVDAALLLEASMPFEFDLLIALDCERDEQARRLLAKGGRSRAEVRNRLDSQAGIRDEFDRADVVVDTRGSKCDVLADIDRRIDRLLEKAD